MLDVFFSQQLFIVVSILNFFMIFSLSPQQQQWYGIATNSLNVADNYAQNGIISFGANDILPQNHNDLYGYYCKVNTEH